MSRYPRAAKPNYGLDTGNVYAADLGTPALADDDWLVAAATDMRVGTYTLAHTHSVDDLPRNVTLTHADVVATDTPGTITVVGLDVLGGVISEVLTPSANAVVVSDAAFASVTSVTGAGWVVSSGTDKDHVKLGFGNKVGFPSGALRRAPAVAAAGQVFGVMLDGALVAAAVAFDPDVLANCTVDASASTYDGSKRLVALVLR